MARRGDMLFVIEPSPYRLKLQQAEASQAAAEASLVASEADFSRQSTLVRSDFASRAAVDQSRQKRDSDKSNLSSQQAAVTLAAINLAYTNVAAPFDGLVSALVQLRQEVGPSLISLYNLYPTATIVGSAAPGFSSGEALTLMEDIASATLTPGSSYEWTAMAYQEKAVGTQIL